MAKSIGKSVFFDFFGIDQQLVFDFYGFWVVGIFRRKEITYPDLKMIPRIASDF